MTRKMIFTVFIILILMPTISYGDEPYKFTRITCAKEINYLEIEAICIYNIRNYVWQRDPKSKKSQVNLKNMKMLEEKYGLFSEPIIKTQCKLARGDTVKIEIKYGKPRATGQCGADPSAFLNLWVDDFQLIKHIPFHETCWNNPSVHKISLRFEEDFHQLPYGNMLIRLKEGLYYGYVLFDLTESQTITMDYINKRIEKNIQRSE